MANIFDKNTSDTVQFTVEHSQPRTTRRCLRTIFYLSNTQGGLLEDPVICSTLQDLEPWISNNTRSMEHYWHHFHPLNRWGFSIALTLRCRTCIDTLSITAQSKSNGLKTKQNRSFWSCYIQQSESRAPFGIDGTDINWRLCTSYR